MKKSLLVNIAGGAVLFAISMLLFGSERISAQYPGSQPSDAVFDHYRAAIKDSFQIDIKDFREKLTGGMADGKPITQYDLGQLLDGIKWEREHVGDSFVALEIAMDHLDRIPDYYSRVSRLETDALSDRLVQM